MNNGGYPMGAENDPSAPYNQGSDNEKRLFDVFISQTLSKSTIVHTDDYFAECYREIDSYDYIIDTSDTNWVEAYKEEKYTPLELINYLKWLCTTIKERELTPKEKRKLDWIIKECEDWTEDDLEVMEEK